MAISASSPLPPTGTDERVILAISRNGQGDAESHGAHGGRLHQAR